MTKSTHITRRNPEMEKYVEIIPAVTKDLPNAQIVQLKVGFQSFTINDYCDDLDTAEWMRDMLCTAIANIVKSEAKGKKSEGDIPHELVNNTLIGTADGIVALCTCGWSSGPRISSFVASAAFNDHREKADNDRK